LNYIHLIDRLSTNEMLLKFNNIDHSTDEKERVTIIAKMRENKNKATNRGVIPLFAEPYEIEWTCSERQRVEMKMNEINEWIAFQERWKVRKEKQRLFEERDEAIEQNAISADRKNHG